MSSTGINKNNEMMASSFNLAAFLGSLNLITYGTPKMALTFAARNYVGFSLVYPIVTATDFLIDFTRYRDDPYLAKGISGGLVGLVFGKLNKYPTKGTLLMGAFMSATSLLFVSLGRN